ncbi:MAG: hypothetical protein SF172_16720 [Burkholderiales bacterium]|nr:hypothetical protein [Burkholderiales bacterium]
MTGSAHWRRGMKALHEIAALGVGGGLVCCLVIGMTANAASPAEFAVSRKAIAAIANYVLLPSMALVLISGLLSIAATRGFHDAGWAWLKLFLGISVFEATLLTIGASSRLAEFTAANVDPDSLASMLSSERKTLWILIGLSVANVALAVWRPRLLIKIR